jgi:hypothetical protein
LIRSIVILTYLLSNGACASRSSQSRDASDADYAVYAAVLARVKYQVRVAEETEEGWRCDSASASFCDPRRFSKEFQEAFRDYATKQAQVTVLPRPPAPARPAARWQVPPGEASRCWPMPTASFSRVGYNSDSTHAVVSYSESTGPGPFPGCGYVSGQLLLLQRDNLGGWRVATVALEFIT